MNDSHKPKSDRNIEIEITKIYKHPNLLNVNSFRFISPFAGRSIDFLKFETDGDKIKILIQTFMLQLYFTLNDWCQYENETESDSVIHWMSMHKSIDKRKQIHSQFLTRIQVVWNCCKQNEISKLVILLFWCCKDVYDIQLNRMNVVHGKRKRATAQRNQGKNQPNIQFTQCFCGKKDL